MDGPHRVDEEEGLGEDVEHRFEAILDLLLSGDTRGVDIIYTRANLVGVAVVPEGVKELHVTF